MKSTKIVGRIITAVVAAQLISMPALAQESAYVDLDACTRGEQEKLTVKGAAAGMFAGFAGAMLTGKKDKAGKAALLGLAGGAAAGFATAYYTAIDTCKKQNPQWVTEANLVRDPSKSLKQVKVEHGYQPARDGIKVALKDIRAIELFMCSVVKRSGYGEGARARARESESASRRRALRAPSQPSWPARLAARPAASRLPDGQAGGRKGV